MIKEPLFSIAVLTYNRLAMLKKAVDSALRQTYRNIEIVVFNDCSNDGTKEWLDKIVLQDSRIKAVNHSKNIGLCANVRSIPANINGKYLVILADDNWLEKEFVSNAIKDLEENEKATIWYCRSLLIIKNEFTDRLTMLAPKIEEGVEFVKHNLNDKREVTFDATVYRVSILKDFDCFKGNTLTIDFSSRCLCALQGMVVFNPGILVNYVIWGGNISSLSSTDTWMRSNEEIYILLKDQADSFSYRCAAFYFLIRSIASVVPIKLRTCLKYIVRALEIERNIPIICCYFIIMRRLPVIFLRALLPLKMQFKLKSLVFKLKGLSVDRVR